MTLREWRHWKGLTLREARDALGPSPATLSRIERGRRPNWQTATAIHEGTAGRVKRDELLALNGAAA